MDKVFDIYLAKADQPESGACAELSLPATPYQLLDALDKLRLAEGDTIYWEVSEYHAFEEMSAFLNDSCSVYELNALAHQLAALNERQCTAFAGLLKMEQAKGEPIPISRLIDLAYSTDCCHVVEEALNDSQLGRFSAENGFCPELEDLSDKAFELLDLERIGREHRQGERGVFVERSMDHPGGYVVQHTDLVEAYKSLDLTPKAPDYTILLKVFKGFFNDPEYDHDKTIQLKLPFTQEDLDAVFTELDVCDLVEVNWSCLDCKVPSLTEMISDNESGIGFLDRIAQRLSDMEPKTLNTYKALLSTAGCSTLQQAEQLMDTLDQYIFSPQFSSPIEVARGELSVILCSMDVERILPYLNLYQYGQSLIQDINGVLTGYGMLERKDWQPVQSVEPQPQQGGMEMK